MISYSYALEGETTWLFENNALAVFGVYSSWYGPIGTVSAIIIAVSYHRLQCGPVRPAKSSSRPETDQVLQLLFTSPLQVGKPVAAKLSNVFGRAEAWMIATVLYTIGFIILATSSNVHAFAAGWFLRSAGYAATQILIVVSSSCRCEV